MSTSENETNKKMMGTSLKNIFVSYLKFSEFSDFQFVDATIHQLFREMYFPFSDYDQNQ